MKTLWWLLVMIAFLIILDQITKGMVDSSFQLGESVSVIDGFFSITYVRNTGAAWGVLQQAGGWMRQVFLLWGPVAVVLGCIVWLVKTINKEPFYMSLSIALIVAGAIGNLIDRFSLGFVVDFFDFYIGSWHWPAFNVADSCITVAAVIFIYDAFFLAKKRTEKSTKDGKCSPSSSK